MKKDVPLFLYNTLTRKKEKFKPIKKGHVGLYSCGPTVYWYAHIGNMRSYIFSDILRRVLEYNGYAVKHVMNVTDVGHLAHDADSGVDRIEEAARNEHKSAQEIANFYLNAFKKDMTALHIETPHVWPKATEHISEQIALIKKLEKKKYTYKTSDGIYFDSAKFKHYGDLARLNIKGLQEGKRIAVGEKKNKTDFALWKFSEKLGVRQQEWESPWGVGYPGWHIECSAMSMKYLGEHFDIHTGGEDHVPIHHTNEIAQSEAATGKKFVNYWLHGAFLTFRGEKVSKSKGGLYTISELKELGYKPEHYRYLCLLTHYRKPLDFSLDALSAARTAFEKLFDKYLSLASVSPKAAFAPSYEEVVTRYSNDFREAVNDDLNLPKALGIVWDLLRDSEVKVNITDKIRLLLEFDGVLGLGIDSYEKERVVYSEEVKKLILDREKARKDKNWKLSDKIRDEIRKLGYELEDSLQGTVVRKA